VSDLRPPPLRFPDPVRADLDAKRPGLADETEQMLASHVKPCVAITSHRVSNAPLRRNAITRLLGARVATPKLDVTESKLGGTPYCETEEDWREHRFLGQIDLATATSVLPPDAPRLSGLVRIDFKYARTLAAGFRVRWFRDPSESRAVRAPISVRSHGTWETRLAFDLAWTLPEGDALEAIWPLPETPWFEYDRFFPPGYNTDDNEDYHRLLGHKASGLDDHYGFEPPAGCGRDLHDYECLLRLTLDHLAGFHWGSNVVYLLVPTPDLVAGDLSRIVITAANT
jgi:hypothetical protein